MTTREKLLVRFGLECFAELRDQKPSEDLLAGFSSEDTLVGQAYLEVLGKKQDPPTSLRKIFDFIDLKSSNTNSRISFWAGKPLALTNEVFKPSDQDDSNSLDQMWEEFQKEYKSIPNDNDQKLFLSFYHLMQKYAWCLPALYCQPGVSLFQEWKAVCALVYATSDTWRTAPASTYSLVGGDIPGIQDFVYTISSAGAARGLRGRSFFIQLLGDAIVQRLISELHLSWANVIYAAGGNFMLLAPALDQKIGQQTVEECLHNLKLEFEKILLDHFEGDLSVCLAWKPLQRHQISSQEFSDPCSRGVKEEIASQKQQRFSGVVESSWDRLFIPQNKPGNRHCKICQRILSKSEGREEKKDNTSEYICKHCDSFADLARRLSRANLMHFSKTKPTKIEFWQVVLHEISHQWIQFNPGNHTLNSDDFLYTINSTEFLTEGGVGFKFLANTTPLATQYDLEMYDQAALEDSDEVKPEPGQSIRTLNQLAATSRGVEKLGFLRMDVDNLGAIMVRGLKRRGMAETSTLSACFEWFFAGWLNKLCEQVNQEAQVTDPKRGDGLYIIYSGGDDLFVVGSWNLIPTLASKIQADFLVYTGNNPNVHISAGITLENPKFPLYQAAERAGQAEEAAKRHTKNNQDKNAVSFLGVALKWEDWKQVESFRQEIAACLGSQQVPQALIQVILDIYQQYLHELDRVTGTINGAPQIPYGPWMWRATYALKRLAYRVKDLEARNIVLKLQEAATSPDLITPLALAARWEDFLTRKGD